MSLTGRAIILLSGALTALTAAAIILLWRRGGRWRIPARVIGLLILEVFVVLTAGLVVNHREQFYPSWQALAGSHERRTESPPPVGRLDRTLTDGAVVRWSPPELARWRLAGSPLLIAPVGYARHRDLIYPVIVVLAGADQVASISAQAATIRDVLTVIAVPTRYTTPAALAALPARLALDVRAAGTGWAIVAGPGHTTLARQWHDLVSARFRTVSGTLTAAADRLPPPLKRAVRLNP